MNKKQFEKQLSIVFKKHNDYLIENKKLIKAVESLDYNHIHITSEAGSKNAPMLLAYENHNFAITDESINILFMGLDEDEVIERLKKLAYCEL